MIPMALTTSSPTDVSTSPEVPAGLHLTGVLASGLPVEVGTGDEPARYTVPAVFSRKVTAEERARIEDPHLAQFLSRSGYLQLAVSDRRLLIKNTSLAELKGGLARDLAAALRRIEMELGAEHDRLEAESATRRVSEQQRATELVRLAAEIRFE